MNKLAQFTWRLSINIDWNIEGSYTPNGEVKIVIDAPLTLGFTLKGKVSQN